MRLRYIVPTDNKHTSAVPHPQLNSLQQVMGPAQPAKSAPPPTALSFRLPTPTSTPAPTPIMPITEQLPPAIIPQLEPNSSN